MNQPRWPCILLWTQRWIPTQRCSSLAFFLWLERTRLVVWPFRSTLHLTLAFVNRDWSYNTTNKTLMCTLVNDMCMISVILYDIVTLYYLAVLTFNSRSEIVCKSGRGTPCSSTDHIKTHLLKLLVEVILWFKGHRIAHMQSPPITSLATKACLSFSHSHSPR